jgi:hypothetical protein
MARPQVIDLIQTHFCRPLWITGIITIHCNESRTRACYC